MWACKDAADPDVFFHDRPRMVREARKVCLGCQAKPECLEYIRGIEQRYGRQPGVWAGLTREDRQGMWIADEAAVNLLESDLRYHW